MLEQVETMFDGMLDMMKKLKKASYEKHMKAFRERNGHFFTEMIQYVEEKEGMPEKEAAAREVADVFADAVQKNFSVKGKIRPRTQIDLNFFMIYYVFPALLLTEGENQELIADSIRDKWGEKFKDSKIQYADYDKIYGAFREKIFGIF